LWTDPAENYQWYRAGAAIPEATNRYYVPTDSEITKYQVTVSDTSSTIDLWVYYDIQVVDSRFQPIANAEVNFNGTT